MVADPKGSARHILGTNALKYKKKKRNLVAVTKIVLATKHNGEWSRGK
jgi:hypothetical protein